MEDFSPPDLLREFYAWVVEELKDLHVRINGLVPSAPPADPPQSPSGPSAPSDSQENAGG